MGSAYPQFLLDRLRKPESLFSVKGSLPILFFGNYRRASAATVGLNPSDREYDMLPDGSRRFLTLTDCGVSDGDRSRVSDSDCDRAIRRMETYFRGRIHQKYFGRLLGFAEGLEADYNTDLVHLDLSQEATEKKYQEILKWPFDFAALFKDDMEFLRLQIEPSQVHLIFANGTPVYHAMVSMFPGPPLRRLSYKETGKGWSIQVWAHVSKASDTKLAVIGWSTPLSSVRGLTLDDAKRIGRNLRKRLTLAGLWQGRAAAPGPADAKAH